MAGLSMTRRQMQTAFASLTGMVVSVHPILIAPFAVFLQPVSNEFGWGRDIMPTALLIATITATILYPFVGRLLDRFGPRAILLPGFAFFGLAVCSLSQISHSTHTLYGLFMLAGALSTLPTGIAFARLLSRTFVENRGLMLGICLGVGGGLGAALTPVVAHALIEQFGWRGAYIGLGLAPLLVGLPITALYVMPPKGVTTDPIKETPEFGLELSATALLPSFYIIVAGIFVINMVMGGTISHFIALATDRGISQGTATAMVSIASIATLTGQLAIGLALDRVRTPLLILPVIAVLLCGLLTVHHATGHYLLTLGIILMGLGAGSEYGILPYFLTRLFGLRAFGQIYGIIYASSAVSYGIGPVLMGHYYETAGSYGPALIVFEVLLVLIAILFAQIRTYSFEVDGRPM